MASSSSQITYSSNKDNILGKGAYATVFRGFFNGVQVAVKRVQLVDINDEREILAMEKLNHQNVVKLYHAHEDGEFKLYALELCDGSLYDYCKKKYREEAIPRKLDAMLQMAEGLQYIHSNKFVHRDIKPANILISRTEPVNLKLGDFGLSKQTDSKGRYSLTSGIKGTEDWMAPELLQFFSTDKEEGLSQSFYHATNASDIFALGCVFFYFLVFCHPFGRGTLITENIRKNLPVNWDEKAGNGIEFGMIRQMIRQWPRQRISLPKVIYYLRVFQAGEIVLEDSVNQFDGSKVTANGMESKKKKSTKFLGRVKEIFSKKEDKNQFEQQQQKRSVSKSTRPLSTINENPSIPIAMSNSADNTENVLMLESSTLPLSQYEQLPEPLAGFGNPNAVSIQRSNSQRLSEVTRNSYSSERRHSTYSYNSSQGWVPPSPGEVRRKAMEWESREGNPRPTHTTQNPVIGFQRTSSVRNLAKLIEEGPKDVRAEEIKPIPTAKRNITSIANHETNL